MNRSGTSGSRPCGLQLDHVSVGYGATPVVDDLSLAVQPGTFVAVLGPNGCGKSTLLRAIARLLPSSAGSILLDGRDIATRSAKELARELGMLSQTNTAPEGMRVVDLVARGRHPHRSAFSRWSPGDEAAVAGAMADA